jgi:phytol kinase
MNIVISIIIFLGLFISVDWLKKKFAVKGEYSRKIVHIFSGIVILFLSFFILSRNEIIILTIVFAVLLYISKTKNFFHSIHEVERKTYGEITFPLGVLLVALYALPNSLLLYFYGVSIMSFADGFGGLIGYRWGKQKIHSKLNKSWLGSITFFSVCLLITIIVLLMYNNYNIDMILLIAIIISLLLSFIEFLLVQGFDNLLLPISAAILLNYLMILI